MRDYSSEHTLAMGGDCPAELPGDWTGHPALTSLVPVNPAYKRLPAVVADEVGNCAVQVSLRAGPGAASYDLEIALLVLTPPKEEGGS